MSQLALVSKTDIGSSPLVVWSWDLESHMRQYKGVLVPYSAWSASFNRLIYAWSAAKALGCCDHFLYYKPESNSQSSPNLRPRSRLSKFNQNLTEQTMGLGLQKIIYHLCKTRLVHIDWKSSSFQFVDKGQKFISEKLLIISFGKFNLQNTLFSKKLLNHQFVCSLLQTSH